MHIVMTLHCAANIHIQCNRAQLIDIHSHGIKKLVEEKMVIHDQCATERKIADCFTKDLDANKLEILREYMEMCLNEEVYLLHVFSLFQPPQRLYSLSNNFQPTREEGNHIFLDYFYK